MMLTVNIHVQLHNSKYKKTYNNKIKIIMITMKIWYRISWIDKALVTSTGHFQ